MKIRKRYIAIAISVLLVLIGITATFALTQKPTEPTTSDFKPIPIENKNGQLVVATLDSQEIIKLTNDYRATKGLAPLIENELLNNSACAKAQHMVDNNYWSHVSPDGIQPWYYFDQAGYLYDGAGENQAFGYPSDTSVIDGLIKSPTHEENLVGDYTETGVCVLMNVDFQGKRGTNVIVVHYGRP